MASFNKVILIGNLVDDPERRSTNSGVAVADMRLAVNRHWTDRNTGQSQKETCFIDVTAWSHLAELCFSYLKKGRPVMFEGYLKQETWEDKNNPGQKRSKIKVVAESMQFIGGNDNAGGSSSDDSSFSAPPPRAAASDRPAPASGPSQRNSGNGPPPNGGRSSGYTRSGPSVEEAEEDIPF